MEKLPIYSDKFIELRENIGDNYLLYINGEDLRVTLEGLNVDITSIKPYEDEVLIVQKHTIAYLSNLFEKALWANPVIWSIATFKDEGEQRKISYKIMDILREMEEAIFFYDYKTNFFNSQKSIYISYFQNTYYIYYRIPLFKYHLPNLFSYLKNRISCIEKGDFSELDNFYSLYPLSDHWTLGSASIGNTLLKIDMAISSSNSRVEYAIEDFDSTYIIFSIIFTIPTS